MVDVHFLI